MATVFIASDHAGLALKEALAAHLRGQGHEVNDLGPPAVANPSSVDYPIFAHKAAVMVRDTPGSFGVLICGSGVGMSMAANRIKGVRAALCTNEYLARMSRAHNDANVLCLGERVVGHGLALAIADAFLSGVFEGGRHARRVALIEPQT